MKTTMKRNVTENNGKVWHIHMAVPLVMVTGLCSRAGRFGAVVRLTAVPCALGPGVLWT